MGNATKKGLPGEVLFTKWYNNSAEFYGLDTAKTLLDDKTGDTAYSYVADQDYHIKSAETGKILRRHEVKTFSKALKDGNLLLQVIFTGSDETVAKVRERIDPNPETGEPVTHLTSIAYTYKTGNPGTVPPPDYYHFYLQVTNEIQTAEIREDERRAFEQIPAQEGERERKLITEAPVGIWVNLDYYLFMQLKKIEQADAYQQDPKGQNIYELRDRTDKKRKEAYGEYPLVWAPQNFNTSLIMVAEEREITLPEDEAHFHAMVRYAKSGEARLTHGNLVLPVVKCGLTPKLEAEEKLPPYELHKEIMQPERFSYYMPERLYSALMNYSYTFENTRRVKSAYAGQGYSEQLRKRLLDEFRDVHIF